MADFQSRLDEFLRPPKEQSHWTSFIQQQEERIQQEKVYTEAYHSYYPPEDPKDAGYYSWKKDVKKCGNKLKVIFAYLCGESQLDKTENPKERAWNIWLTARSTLLTAVLQGTFELQNSGELGVCANRANDAKKSFTEDKDAEWKDMDDASQLCGEMRVRMFAQKLNKASLQKGKGADSSETQ